MRDAGGNLGGIAVDPSQEGGTPPLSIQDRSTDRQTSDKEVVKSKKIAANKTNRRIFKPGLMRLSSLLFPTRLACSAR